MSKERQRSTTPRQRKSKSTLHHQPPAQQMDGWVQTDLLPTGKQQSTAKGSRSQAPEATCAFRPWKAFPSVSGSHHCLIHWERSFLPFMFPWIQQPLLKWPSPLRLPPQWACFPWRALHSGAGGCVSFPCTASPGKPQPLWHTVGLHWMLTA